MPSGEKLDLNAWVIPAIDNRRSTLACMPLRTGDLLVLPDSCCSRGNTARNRADAPQAVNSYIFLRHPDITVQLCELSIGEISSSVRGTGKSCFASWRLSPELPFPPFAHIPLRGECNVPWFPLSAGALIPGSLPRCVVPVGRGSGHSPACS